jgi:hypothetical protein
VRVWRTISWFAHHMRCVLITAFGAPVEPEVKRNLAIVSGPTRACAASTSALGVALGQCVDHSVPAGDGVDRFLELLSVGNENQAGVTSSIARRSCAKSLDTSEYAGETGA